MSKRFLVVFALLMAITAPAYARFVPGTSIIPAQSDETQVVVPPGEKIKLALATDLSNLLPEPGTDYRNAALLAVDQWNEAGGIMGFEIELVVEDDRCEGAEATNVANLFASDPQIMAVVGHVCSGASIPASTIYNDARIPMASVSTAAAFTAQGYDITNRISFSDAAQGVVDARYIREELGAEVIGILHDNTDYGKGLADEVQKEFENLGGSVVFFQAIDVDDQDYRPVLTVLAEEAVDVVFFGGYQNQAALLVNQMQEVGMQEVIFFSDDGVLTEAYIDQAGEAAEGSYASFTDDTAFANAEANDAFDEAYEEAFGVAPDELGPYHGHAYDGANIILSAIEKVATVDDEGNLIVGREELIQAIRDTENFEGLTGVLTCDDMGECGAGIVGINVVEDGEWVPVEVPSELQLGGGDADMDEEDMDDSEDDDADDDDSDDAEDDDNGDDADSDDDSD